MPKPDPFRTIPPDVLNTDQLAERLGYKPETVRAWVRDGIVPGKLLGKEWRFWWPQVVITLFSDGEDDDHPEATPPWDRAAPAP